MRIFLRLGDELITFNENSSSIDTNVNKHEYFLNDIKYVLKKAHNLNFSYIEPYFYEMYIYDAILGNFDRHSGNWGITKNKDKKYMSPLYDNAVTLLPRSNFGELGYVNRKNWFKERVYTFPGSKIMIDNPTNAKARSSYYEVVNNYVPEDYIVRFRGWDLDSIFNKVFSEPELNEKQIKFYRDYITLRYKCIIEDEKSDEVWESLNYKSKKGGVDLTW